MRFTLFTLGIGLVALLSFTTTQRNQPSLTGASQQQPAAPLAVTVAETRISPQFARQFVLLPPGRLQEIALLDQSDPAQSMQSMEELFATPDSVELEEITAWLVGNPAHAADWIESLPDGSLRNLIVERLLAAVAGRDPQASLAIADAMTTNDLRDSATSTVFKRWAADAPHDAFAAITAREDLRDSPILGRAFVAAVSEHPQSISEFLTILPAGSIDSSFVARVAETLLAKDPAALTYLWEGSQHLAWRSVVADVMLQHLGRNGPELAFDWATQLDPNRRSEALQALFRRALQRDRHAAPALLNSIWLDDADRGVLASLVE